MPIVVGMPPAMQAYVLRARELTGDASAVQAELDRSTEGADLAAAFQHHESLELLLRREDGSLIRTEDIGVVDTHRLIELWPDGSHSEHVEEWQSDGFREWAIGAIDETKFARYQIQVELFDDAAIP